MKEQHLRLELFFLLLNIPTEQKSICLWFVELHSWQKQKCFYCVKYLWKKFLFSYIWKFFLICKIKCVVCGFQTTRKKVLVHLYGTRVWMNYATNMHFWVLFEKYRIEKKIFVSLLYWYTENEFESETYSTTF